MNLVILRDDHWSQQDATFSKIVGTTSKKIWHHGTSWGEGLQLESPEVTDLASLVTPDGMRGKG